MGFQIKGLIMEDYLSLLLNAQDSVFLAGPGSMHQDRDMKNGPDEVKWHNGKPKGSFTGGRLDKCKLIND